MAVFYLLFYLFFYLFYQLQMITSQKKVKIMKIGPFKPELRIFERTTVWINLAISGLFPFWRLCKIL